MGELKRATEKDLRVIQAIAYQTWPATFGDVMPKKQIDYLLALIYNENSLKEQMIEKKHQFILALNDNGPVGFASYELRYCDEPQLMIHKIYLLPESQGLGIGRNIFDCLTALGKAKGHEKLRLKVFHRNEKAAAFYRKYGFTNAGTESTDIGNGYIILDNVMTKEL